jgi:DNA-binding NarL/FixJ family response regulator
MKFEAIHKTLNTVSVELVGSAITYNPHESCRNIIKLDSINPVPFMLKKSRAPKKINRELEVLELICKGKSTLETSETLFWGSELLKPTEQTFRKNR